MTLTLKLLFHYLLVIGKIVFEKIKKKDVTGSRDKNLHDAHIHNFCGFIIKKILFLSFVAFVTIFDLRNNILEKGRRKILQIGWARPKVILTGCIVGG